MADQPTKLKRFIKANHLVSEGVAKEADVQLTDFYRYSSGAILPTEATAQKISDALTRILNRPVFPDDVFDHVSIVETAGEQG